MGTYRNKMDKRIMHCKIRFFRAEVIFNDDGTQKQLNSIIVYNRCSPAVKYLPVFSCLEGGAVWGK